MEVKNTIKILQDQMGVPFFPVVFQFLMVLTFTLHIFFVNLAIGTLLISLYLSFKRDEFSKRLSSSLIKMTPISISLAILFGIAPLLFVQVIYDAFFYTASTLLGFYVTLFIFSMMIAYTSVYIGYYNKEKKEGIFKFFVLLALLLFFFSGFIIHSVIYLSLLPDKWMSLYTSLLPVNTSGLNLKYFQISRFLHFIIPSLIQTGIIIMLYSDYFKNREDFEKNYLEWSYKFGSKIALLFLIIQILIGIWFLLEVPFEFKFFFNHFLIVGIIFSLVLFYLLYVSSKKVYSFPKIILLLSLITIFLMSYAREILRMNYLSQYGYSIYNYKMNLDIGSTLLFFLTFVMGLVIISFILYISFKAGKVKGVYTSSEKEIKWGKFSIILMVLWLAIVVLLGIIITIKNIS
ncbi:MAG: hypothetical protein ABIN21_05180 [candidate division WOR-3 bacterium]